MQDRVSINFTEGVADVRLDRPDKARGAIQQAQIALDQLPNDADYATTTTFNREEWRLLLGDMSRW